MRRRMGLSMSANRTRLPGVDVGLVSGDKRPAFQMWHVEQLSSRRLRRAAFYRPYRRVRRDI
jgi:hypothetical protein